MRDEQAVGCSRRRLSHFASRAKVLRSRPTMTGKDQRALAGRKIGVISEVENLGT